eukprot:GHVN01053947.1.p1 GENE.GHVN01053947.1~~GHVN01053947.1.p1  ORF type:complete len:632 (+),score=56.71 GHVN01053947.1:203-2098(+)
MSQFRDTFTKEDKKDNLLDYDDSASLYFVATVLACILIPWTWTVLNYIFKAKEKKLEPYYPERTKLGSTVAYCKCSVCVEKRIAKTSEVCSYKHRLTTSVRAQIWVLAFLWLCFLYTCTQLTQVELLGGFDPFEILGIEAGADDKAIKKAYRAMSLKYHPDRNPTDPTAGAKFIMISKAYKSLTDEIAKMNFEKYGNPDGPGVMKIGIGLPRFLVDQKNQLPILCFFFTLLLVVIPISFISYYNHQQRFNKGVERITYTILSHKMTQGTQCENFPELLAASAESQQMDLRDSDTKEIADLVATVEEGAKRCHNGAIVRRNTTLILGHMQRLHHLLSPSLKEDITTILSKALPITNAMLEIALVHRWTGTVEAVIDFRRRLIQALGISSSTLLQVPHLDQEMVKTLAKGKNGVKELNQLVANRKEILEEPQKLKELSPEGLLDVSAMCNHVSDVDIKAKIYVEGEEDLVQGDTATCLVTMTRTNLQEGEAMGAVHAPHFPGVKFEEWFFILTDKRNGELHGMALTKNRERVVTERIKFPLSNTGIQQCQMTASCDSYAGLDKTIDLVFKVHSQQEKPRSIFVHEEDEQLDNEPTLFGQLMSGQGATDPQDSSDDENDGKPIDNEEVASSDED